MEILQVGNYIGFYYSTSDGRYFTGKSPNNGPNFELIPVPVNINFVAFSYYSNDISGQIFTIFILTVAAAEAAIGLAIIVSFFRNRGSIAVEDINSLKG